MLDIRARHHTPTGQHLPRSLSVAQACSKDRSAALLEDMPFEADGVAPRGSSDHEGPCSFQSNGSLWCSRSARESRLWSSRDASARRASSPAGKGKRTRPNVESPVMDQPERTVTVEWHQLQHHPERRLSEVDDGG